MVCGEFEQIVCDGDLVCGSFEVRVFEFEVVLLLKECQLFVLQGEVKVVVVKFESVEFDWLMKLVVLMVSSFVVDEM